MKTKLVITSLLLLSLVACAASENAADKDQVTNKMKLSNPIEKVIAQLQNGSIKEDDVAAIAKTLQEDIETAADIAESVTLTFKIKKGESHNTQTWLELITQTIDLIEHASELQKEEKEAIFEKFNSFIKNCVELSGDQSDIHGEFSIKLDAPKSHLLSTYSN